jgi:hypothetical protein
MNRWETWLLHVLSGAVTITGVVYFWMKYLLKTEDPFQVINHPWQPFMLNSHILLAPGLIFAVGLITKSHILKKLDTTKVNRSSGLLALFSFPCMVLSGYLLQVVSDEISSRVVLILHLSTGILFAGAYLVHQMVTFRVWWKRLKQRQARHLVIQKKG